MGAFNIVRGHALCPKCNRSARFDIQFKYGDTWQHEYQLGDVLRWGGNDIGLAGSRKVVVEGIGGPCPHCGVDYLDFDIIIAGDRIAAIEESRGLAAASPKGYVVLEP